MPIRLLYLDTSADETLVSWMEDERVIAEEIVPGSRDHGLHIHRLINSVCERVQHPLSALHGVVVMNGPGSYTGLRISLSVAKGFCFALHIPLFLLNKLDVMALASLVELPKGERIILARARANEYFYGVYNEEGHAIVTPKVVDFTDWQHQNQPIYTYQADLAEEFPRLKHLTIPSKIRCKASFKAFFEKKEADLMHSEPFYLKNVFINKINKL
jgi:tRNA threonylcarbamoyladenosine biosynthesis protein TsaB